MLGYLPLSLEPCPEGSGLPTRWCGKAKKQRSKGKSPAPLRPSPAPRRLKPALPDLQEESGEVINFRRTLLNKCQVRAAPRRAAPGPAGPCRRAALRCGPPLSLERNSEERALHRHPRQGCSALPLTYPPSIHPLPTHPPTHPPAHHPPTHPPTHPPLCAPRPQQKLPQEEFEQGQAAMVAVKEREARKKESGEAEEEEGKVRGAGGGLAGRGAGLGGAWRGGGLVGRGAGQGRAGILSLLFQGWRGRPPSFSSAFLVVGWVHAG